MQTFRARTIPEYFQIIRRRKLLIILVVLTMLISTFFVFGGISDVYESGATVVVASDQYDRQATPALVAAATEQLTSRSFLEPIIDRYNLYPGAVSSGAIDAAVGSMNRAITLETKYRANLPEKIYIAYRNPDPRVARDVATDLVGLFDSINGAIQKQLTDEISALNSEIAEVEAGLNSSGQQRAAAAARSGASARARAAANVSRMEQSAAASSVESLSDRKLALERQIAEQKRQIAEQQNFLKAAPASSTARGSSSYGILLVRKAEIEAQLKEYASQYTDKNPKVIQAKTQLVEIDRQITQLDSSGQGSGAPINPAETRELRALQREMVRMETELEVTRREIERKQSLNGAPTIVPASAASVVPAGIPAGNPIDFGHERLRNLYKTLLDKKTQLQHASLRKSTAEAAGISAGFFQIIDMPGEPKVPVGPDRSKLWIYAVIFALFLGLAVAVIAEIPRLLSIRNYRDVEYYLGTPVVGLIPETLTPPERSRKRTLALGRSLALIVLAGVLVPVLVVVLNYLQIFQVLASR